MKSYNIEPGIDAPSAVGSCWTVTPAAKRKAVAHLIRNHGMSERRACKPIGSCRMTAKYRTRRQDDTVLIQRMTAIAKETTVRL